MPWWEWRRREDSVNESGGAVVGDQPALLGDKGFFGAPYEAVRGLDRATGTYRLCAGQVRPHLGGRAAVLTDLRGEGRMSMHCP